MVQKGKVENDQYNELNKSMRRSMERDADPNLFFNKSGNPFLGFMHFLQRKPVPKKAIDEQRLMADFAEYAKERRRMSVITTIAVLAFIFLSMFAGPISILVIVILIIVLIKGNNNRRYYSIEDYKAYVIERAISSEVEELVYEPHFGLPESVFKDVNIVIRGNRYKTEDLVTGKYNGVYFAQSDLTIQYHGNKHTITYFKGRWVSIDYPKQFTGTVVIIENKFSYGCKRKELEKIELENPEFNNVFTVRSSDMQLAYYLLTPQIMERLLYLRQNAKGHIVACFHNGVLHIGVNNRQNSFEPNINNVNLYADIEKFRYEFSLVSGLIEILKIDNNVYVEKEKNSQKQPSQSPYQPMQQPYPQQYQQPVQQPYPQQYQQPIQQPYPQQYQQPVQQPYPQQYQQPVQQPYPRQYQQPTNPNNWNGYNK